MADCSARGAERATVQATVRSPHLFPSQIRGSRRLQLQRSRALRGARLAVGGHSRSDVRAGIWLAGEHGGVAGHCLPRVLHTLADSTYIESSRLHRVNKCPLRSGVNKCGENRALHTHRPAWGCSGRVGEQTPRAAYRCIGNPHGQDFSCAMYHRTARPFVGSGHRVLD